MTISLQPLRKYADCTGRASRKEYWRFYGLQMAVMFGLGLLGLILSVLAGFSNPLAMAFIWIPVGLLLFIVAAGCFIPNIATGIRRLHDCSMSGWWMLLCFVPYLGGFALFVLYCLPGDAGANKFGPDPLAPTE